MEALFEFLFKYRPVVFEKGRFAFAAGPATYLVIAIALAVALPALIAYIGADGRYRFDRTRPRQDVYSIDTPPPTVSGMNTCSATALTMS